MQCLFRTTIREKLAQQRNHTINRPIVLISRWSPKSREEGERTERESAVEEMETLMKTRRWRHTTPRVSTYLYDPVDISSSRHVASARLWLAGSFGALSYRRLCKKKRAKKRYFFIYTIPLCVVAVVCERKSSRPRLKIQQWTATGVMFLLVGQKTLSAASPLSLSFCHGGTSYHSGHIDRNVFFLGGNITSISCKSRDYYAGYLFLL